MKRKNKVAVIFILTLVFLWGIASVASAMSGMDMGGGSDKPSAVQTPKASDPHSSGSDTKPEMNQPQSTPSEHEKTSGMDSNMPGMKADEGKEDGHGEEESQGVNWYVVGTFLGINALVIGSAGVLKLKAGMFGI